jgi:hypothetical protein
LTRKKLPKKDPPELRNLQNVAERSAGNRLIHAIHQGTQNTSIFSRPWIGIHPTEPVAHPSGFFCVGTLYYFATLIAAGLLKVFM